jgi:hypothetical protein
MFQQFVDEFIIPIPSKMYKEKIINLVEEVIVRQSKGHESKHQETKIDELVNEVCGLDIAERNYIMIQE